MRGARNSPRLLRTHRFPAWVNLQWQLCTLGLYPALHHSPEQQHWQGRHCKGTQRLMPARGIWWTWGNQHAPHTEQSDNPSSHLPVLYLEGALPSPISTLFTNEVTHCYCNDDWLGNLLKVTSSHTALGICFSYNQSKGTGTEGEELNSFPSVSLTPDTHWEVAFKGATSKFLWAMKVKSYKFLNCQWEEPLKHHLQAVLLPHLLVALLLRYRLRDQAGLTCKHVAIQIQGWNMVTWTSEKRSCKFKVQGAYRHSRLQRSAGQDYFLPLSKLKQT